MEQAVFFDLEVRRERVLVPAKKDAGGDGLNIHGRGFQDPTVLGGIFDHFFMEHLVLAPTGHGVKFFETVGERRYVEIAPDEVGGVAILFAGIEVFTDHELKKPDRIGGHGQILGDIVSEFKHCSYNCPFSVVRSTEYGVRGTAKDF